MSQDDPRCSTYEQLIAKTALASVGGGMALKAQHIEKGVIIQKLVIHDGILALLSWSLDLYVKLFGGRFPPSWSPPPKPHCIHQT